MPVQLVAEVDAEVLHFVENLGVRAWKEVQIQHLVGKLIFNIVFNEFACLKIIFDQIYNSYGVLTSSSDYRSNVAPSDSDREMTSRRDSDQAFAGQNANQQHIPKLGLMAPSGDSESGGSHSPSPRASRKRTKLRNQSLTSLCIISHHPFFTTFRECLFILKKLIDACNESSSPKRLGASQKMNRLVVSQNINYILCCLYLYICRDNVWTVLTGCASDATSSIVLHDVKEIETWILRLLSTPVPIPASTRVEVY